MSVVRWLGYLLAIIVAVFVAGAIVVGLAIVLMWLAGQ